MDVERWTHRKATSVLVLSVDDLVGSGDDAVGRRERDRALVLVARACGLVPAALLAVLLPVPPCLWLWGREGSGGQKGRGDECSGGLHVGGIGSKVVVRKLSGTVWLLFGLVGVDEERRRKREDSILIPGDDSNLPGQEVNSTYVVPWLRVLSVQPSLLGYSSPRTAVNGQYGQHRAGSTSNQGAKGGGPQSRPLGCQQRAAQQGELGGRAPRT